MFVKSLTLGEFLPKRWNMKKIFISEPSNKLLKTSLSSTIAKYKSDKTATALSSAIRTKNCNFAEKAADTLEDSLNIVDINV